MMRKLLGYFVGFLIILGVFASLYLAGAIYDTCGKIEIQPYFFRLGLMSTDQIGNPTPLADVQNKKLRNWLVQKYVHECLYVEPDESNIAKRMSRYSPLDYMSDSNAFKKWKNGIAKTIQALSKDGARRTVFVYDEIFQPENSDYLQVDYETKTWYKPNDMTEIPTIKRGTVYLKPRKTSGPVGLKPSEGDQIPKALIGGIDPAVVFSFTIEDVIIDEK